MIFPSRDDALCGGGPKRVGAPSQTRFLRFYAALAFAARARFALSTFFEATGLLLQPVRKRSVERFARRVGRPFHFAEIINCRSIRRTSTESVLARDPFGELQGPDMLRPLS